MARLMLGNHVSVSLASLAAHYGLEGKNVPYDMFRGRHWNELGHDTRAQLGAGCLHDVALTWDIFQRLTVNFPASEYEVIDQTIRAFTEPQLVGDVDALGKVWTYEFERKKELLRELAVTPGDLQSADKFVELLEREGVEVETKAGKNKPIPAIAKTDEFMKGLLEDDNERVRTLAEARLGVRSTLDQTRAERLGYMATRGPMPVYLSYCGAHTTRWSGGDKVNWQNLKRGSNIRKAVGAPAGHVIVKADKSQVEARVLAVIAGQWDLIEKFRNGEDPYIGIASKFYGRPITKDDKEERQFGKVLVLQAGFGASGASIVRSAKRAVIPVYLTDAEGEEAKVLYRSENQAIEAYWRQGGRMLSAIGETSRAIQWGPVTVDTGVIWLPGGVPMWYPEMHYHRDEETGEENWRYKTRRGWARIWGSFLAQNVTQALSRIDMSGSLHRIYARTRIRWAHLEHDAATWVVPVDLSDKFVKIVEEEMTRAPDWLPGIPLGCEVSVGETM